MRNRNLCRRVLVPVLASAALMLGGCSAESGHSDLEQFVNATKARKGGRIEPVPEFKTYEGFEYSAFGRRDPFTAVEAVADTALASNNGISPDLDRHKEPLEGFPLDTLKFAGHLEREGERWAIITAPDGLVHRVQAGNHIGHNYGEIIAISETRIELTEIVPDGLGGWIERQAALALDSEE